MAKLTERQRMMLAGASDADGYSLFGAAEFVTARSLRRRGLIQITLHDFAVITESGRRALEDSNA